MCSLPQISPLFFYPHRAPGLANPETADIGSCGGAYERRQMCTFMSRPSIENEARDFEWHTNEVESAAPGGRANWQGPSDEGEEMRANSEGKQNRAAHAKRRALCSAPRASPPSVRPHRAPGPAGPETVDIRSCGGRASSGKCVLACHGRQLKTTPGILSETRE